MDVMMLGLGLRRRLHASQCAWSGKQLSSHPLLPAVGIHQSACLFCNCTPSLFASTHLLFNLPSPCYATFTCLTCVAHSCHSTFPFPNSRLASGALPQSSDFSECLCPALIFYVVLLASQCRSCACTAIM
jgi:hypothetical protein